MRSDNRPEMTCAEFEQSFDQYVDDMLTSELAAAASRHIACCRACDREVSRWQQTRILLSTAVSDFATAVDVSSVRNDVLARLDGKFTGADELAVRRASRDAELSRGVPARRDARRSKGRERIAAAWRFASAAGVSAMAAAAAVMLLTPNPKSDAPVVASAPAAAVQSASSGVQPAAFQSTRSMFNDVAPVGYTPPPLARRKIPHVDGIEVAPGQLASTWVQPRTNARVIWVQNRGLGAPVRTAGLDR